MPGRSDDAQNAKQCQHGQCDAAPEVLRAFNNTFSRAVIGTRATVIHVELPSAPQLQELPFFPDGLAHS
jgi:hypothetical protein